MCFLGVNTVQNCASCRISVSLVRLLFKNPFCASLEEWESIYGVVFGHTCTGFPAWSCCFAISMCELVLVLPALQGYIRMLVTFGGSLGCSLKIHVSIRRVNDSVRVRGWHCRVPDPVVKNCNLMQLLMQWMAFGSVEHYLCPGVGVVSSPALPVLPSDDRLRNSLSATLWLPKQSSFGSLLFSKMLLFTSPAEYSFMHQIAHLRRKTRAEAFQCLDWDAEMNHKSLEEFCLSIPLLQFLGEHVFKPPPLVLSGVGCACCREIVSTCTKETCKKKMFDIIWDSHKVLPFCLVQVFSSGTSRSEEFMGWVYVCFYELQLHLQKVLRKWSDTPQLCVSGLPACAQA